VITPAQAIASQSSIAARVVRRLEVADLRTIAGVDVSERGKRARAAATLFHYPSLRLLAECVVEVEIDFPYIPGLLAFREVPAMRAALEGLLERPQLVLVDGHGYAHPRRAGCACHLGVELDLPTIGCAKARLVGEFREPGQQRGQGTRLMDGAEVIGRVLRTRAVVKPLFVSIGHRVDLEFAVKTVLACARRYRLPEPLRLADQLSKRWSEARH
jgi:deoxyribonuclease V